MALTYENRLAYYQKVTQDNFNVQNAYLLKTGTFGSIANILAQQDVDARNYFIKVFKEMHPALADDFNSMLFHASFYGVDIDLANPATFSVYFELPDINVDNVYYYKYFIPKNTQFQDKLGYYFLIPEEIEIYIDKTGVKAYKYSQTEGKVQLNVIKTVNNEGYPINLIEYNNVKQLRRDFYKVRVPNYDFGTSYTFDINIFDYKKLNKITTWVNLYNDEDPELFKPIDTNLLYHLDNNEVAQSLKLQPLNIKYFTFGSSKYDYDIFVDIKNTVLTFKTGNGIHGKLLPGNSEIIVEIDTTEGEYGNFENIEFYVNDVDVTVVNLDKSENNYKTMLSGFSVTGGSGGTSVEAVESIRNKIFDQIRIRNSITTEADFETAFKINETIPFIDSKFIDNKSIVFIFNALKYNSKVIETTSLNLTEDQIANNPFYPVITYNNKDFIAPFYFKREDNNVTNAYIVNPKLIISLYTNANVDSLVKVQNQIQLTIEYDFNKRKSYVKLYNTQDDYIYKVRNNLFNIELNYGNGFTWEVDTIYTDDFCIIKEQTYNWVIDIYDKDGNPVISWFNLLNQDNKYHQLVLKQQFYKYYIEIPPVNYDFQTETVVVDYLEDQLKEILSTIEELYQPVKEGEMPYLLRIPFIDKEFYDSINYQEFFTLMDSYFKIADYEQMFSLTSKVQQCFYNTTDLNSNYLDIIFEQKNIEILSPKIPIQIKLTIDKEQLFLSEYESEYDLVFDIKLKIIEELQKFEGFQVNFYESVIENSIIEIFNAKFKVIQNIELVSPKQFIVRDSNTIYYMINKQFGVEELINFAPPYFHFDYDNMDIQTLLV